MDISYLHNIPIFKLDMTSFLLLAMIMLLIGYYLKSKIWVLDRFCIPAPVIGGFLFAILALLLKSSDLMLFNMDKSLQKPLMLAFFTTIGLGASFGLIKKGGKALIIYWGFCALLSILQNVIGVSIAKLMHLDPLIGVLTGSISMEGGHGAAAAFGPTIEKLGISGATTIGLASATFGLVMGGLIGGPIARYLINKNNLSSVSNSHKFSFHDKENESVEEAGPINIKSIFIHIAIICFCIVAGENICRVIVYLTGVVLPNYVGAMFLAVFLRNLNDRINIVKLNLTIVDYVGDISLGLFLSMALMSLQLWTLVDLALPMFVILIAQTIFMIVYCTFVCFKALGGDYDAAVMVSGLAGHGMGATPNAIANMGAVCEKFGESKKAFLIVPLVGAFLIDLIGIPSILFFINVFK
jgi:glutamate:Na+ symporter, ESS family